MADPRMLSEEQLEQLLGQVRFVYEGSHGDPSIDRIKAHIDALAEQLAAANRKLEDIQEYGIDPRNYGDGDANALWERIDEFRQDPDTSLSGEDVRELAEWWAELHESLCDLDDKLCAGIEAHKKAEAETRRIRDLWKSLMCVAGEPECHLRALGAIEHMKGERDEFLDLLQDAFYQMAYPVPDGPMSGWYDTCALSTVRDVGDALTKAGRLERHPDGHGRVRFYRKPETAAAKEGETP